MKQDEKAYVKDLVIQNKIIIDHLLVIDQRLMHSLYVVCYLQLFFFHKNKEHINYPQIAIFTTKEMIEPQ